MKGAGVKNTSEVREQTREGKQKHVFQIRLMTSRNVANACEVTVRRKHTTNTYKPRITMMRRAPFSLSSIPASIQHSMKLLRVKYVGKTQIYVQITHELR